MNVTRKELDARGVGCTEAMESKSSLMPIVSFSGTGVCKREKGRMWKRTDRCGDR